MCTCSVVELCFVLLFRRYEDLITDPEAVMRRLIVGKLGLKWDPNVLNFHSSNRTVHTHSQSRKFLLL